MIRIDQDRLERLLRDFHLLTGFRVGVFDREGAEVYAHPSALSPFCETLRTSPEAAARCARCDREGFLRVAAEGRSVTYRCHIGLVEALMPLAQEGETIGYLMIGQLVSRQPDTDPWRFTELALTSVGVSPDRLRPLFDQLHAMDPPRLQAAFDLLEMSALHLIRQQIVQKERTPPEESLRVAVRLASHRGEGVEALTRRTGLGRTTLYKVAHRTFGQPIGKHLQTLRLTEARHRLDHPEASIASIAEALGMQSASYFARWFRKNSGMTPTEYRRSRNS